MIRTFSYLGQQGFGAYEIDLDCGLTRRVDQDAKSILVPGFVDIHIHGGFGIDFMTGTSDSLLTLCRRLEGVGYEGFLPTTVTSSVSEVRRALDTLTDDPMILGFHLEGPFISRAYPGAQPQSAICSPPTGSSAWDPILDDPRLRVITLAPEEPGALPLIQRLAARGVIVSMGHTNATIACARAGFLAGATNTTHTFNAMRPLHHREAGAVGFALSEDAVACELIYDRVHVSTPAAGILVRAKPAGQLIAVSDGTRASGMPTGSKFQMWGLDVVVGNGDVRLVDGTLAGSAITLLDAFRNLYRDFGPEVAVRATSLNPRRALGLGPAQIYVELDTELQIVARHRVATPLG